MFKKVLQAVGVGGPSVDAVVPDEPVRPGGQLFGEIQVGGASSETSIQRIEVGLVAEVEVGDGQRRGAACQRVQVCDAFDLAAEQYHTLPFTLPVPWQSPITMVNGQPLPGMRLGLLTEAAVANAVDTSDLDPVEVEPLPAQQAVLNALLGMGAAIRRGDLEHGYIRGGQQEFAFYQEIEFFPPAQFAGAVGEIELTFLAHPGGLDVILEADRRGGLFTPGGDAVGRIQRGHEEALSTDWQAEITRWLQAVAEGAHIHGHHRYKHEREHGMGGMFAAGAGGFAAGALGGMVVGELFGDDMGDMMGGLGDMGMGDM